MVELDLEHLVFLDETWASTNMTRRYGRGQKGQRVIDHTPENHWKTITLLASVRVNGMSEAIVTTGAMTKELFLKYIREVLIPTLQKGDIVIMDNSSCHKSPLVAKALEEAGCRAVYLPPYSPDYNPIEKVFSKLKSRLRKEKRRTVDEINQFFATALDDVSPRECRNFFGSCGYKAE
jgi:transposase